MNKEPAVKEIRKIQQEAWQRSIDALYGQEYQRIMNGIRAQAKSALRAYYTRCIPTDNSLMNIELASMVYKDLTAEGFTVKQVQSEIWVEW